MKEGVVYYPAEIFAAAKIKPFIAPLRPNARNRIRGKMMSEKMRDSEVFDFVIVGAGAAGYYQRWIYKGRRHSTATTFLQPAMKRRNLSVRTNAQATQIVLEAKRAVGVAYSAGAGEPLREVRARREVILSAGAANTPKLLMLSGIAAANVLVEVGIAVRQNMPSGNTQIPTMVIAEKAADLILGRPAPPAEYPARMQ